MHEFFTLLAAAGLPSSFFAYLRYQAYLKTVRRIAQDEGVAGLRALGQVAGPWRSPFQAKMRSDDDKATEPE